MTEGGYKKDRFPNLQGQIFDCLICAQVVKIPKQCSGCGNLFCSDCISQYIKKNNTCPNRCGTDINNMSSRALINIYRDLDIKCAKCPKTLKVGDLEKHQDLCGRPKCIYNEFCSGYQNKKQQFAPFCSEKCHLFNSIVQSKADPKITYDLLLKFAPKNIPQKVNLVESTSSRVVVSAGNGTGIVLGWSKKQCGMNIIVSPDNSSVFLKEEAYVFRTVLTTQSFTHGKHYWQIHADAKTQNELKIGVAGSKNFNFDTAFCDHKFGFAFYGLGQLRHGSNATGVQYGKRFKKAGVLGVYLNMDKGTLSFSLNGQDFGQAYQDNDLKVGPLYPAVALLHCSGCIIKGQLPIPQMYLNK